MEQTDYAAFAELQAFALDDDEASEAILAGIGELQAAQGALFNELKEINARLEALAGRMSS